MANQTPNAFCVQCGAPRAQGAKFCTSCGASFDGAARSSRAPAAAPAAAQRPGRFPLPAVAVFLALLAAGGVASYLSNAAKQPSRAVPGSPGMPGGQAGEGGRPALPEGHPSIELPKEALDFLAQLSAEAEKNPTSVEAWMRLAGARYRASAINPTYLQSAQQAVDKVLELDPDNKDALRLSANLAYDGSNFPEAEKRMQAYLAKVPDDVTAITDLGSVMLFQDRDDDAIAQYRLALEKDPKFLQAHFNLAIALQKAGKKDEALAELKLARTFTETAEQQQRIDEAIADMEGRPAPGEQNAAAPGGGMAGMGAGTVAEAGSDAAAAPKPSNATTDFQRNTEALLNSHAIIGSHVQSFQWTGDADVRVMLEDFPMAQMPPFALEKFKSGMNDQLAKLAVDSGVSSGVHLDLVDAADGKVMDSLGVQR